MNVSLSAPAASPSPGKANVLVVDDVAENLVAMRALLQRDDVEVLCAGSGTEALELLLANEVAVALLDVHMPEMDGFSLAELMRGASRSREVPIIFLTASPSDPRRAFKGYEAGAVDFLHKPVEPQVIAGKVKVFVELFQQRRLLRERADTLERALQLNETMMAVLTHDLRTPLSAMLVCAEKLAMQLPDDARVQRTLAHLENSGWRMARMVEQLLDFSRIRSGGLHLQPQPLELGDLLAGAVGEMRRAHPDARIGLQVSGPLPLSGDPDRLAQVVANLVGNAVLHGSGGQVEVAAAAAGTDGVLLRVSNPGRIDDALMPRLFEPFKGSFRSSHGLGLGLFIAQQFVLAHGGRLDAVNRDEQVHFEAWLPSAAGQG